MLIATLERLDPITGASRKISTIEIAEEIPEGEGPGYRNGGELANYAVRELDGRGMEFREESRVTRFPRCNVMPWRLVSLAIKALDRGAL